MNNLLAVSLIGLGSAVLLFLLLVRHRNQSARRQLAWKHISKLIQGVQEGTKTVGTFQDHEVQVFISNHGYEIDIFVYHLRLTVPIRGFDWSIDFDAASILDPTESWRLRSSDESLQRRLTEAGAIDLVKQDDGRPKVRYRADRGMLEYERFVGEETDVPTTEMFQSQLQLLIRLAEMKEKLNVWQQRLTAAAEDEVSTRAR